MYFKINSYVGLKWAKRLSSLPLHMKNRLHTFTVHRTLCSSAPIVYSKLCPFHKNKLQQPVGLSSLSLCLSFSVLHFLWATLATLFPGGNEHCQLRGLTSGASCWAGSDSPPSGLPPPNPALTATELGIILLPSSGVQAGTPCRLLAKVPFI